MRQPEDLVRVSLQQWQAFLAVVDEGGYAQAAERLHKSQSSVSYAVQQLEFLLDVEVFQRQGRKAVLTPAGELLYRRAGNLLSDALRLEAAAAHLADGWEPVIRLAVDTVFPTWLLLDCLARFAAEQPGIRIELLETVLGGTEQALLERQADLVIGPLVPQGFIGEALLHLTFLAVAAPSHPLHRLDRPLTTHDLRGYTQLVIRDSGSGRKHSAGWLGSERRWTVSNKATSIRAVCMGMGFAWYPTSMIRDELDSGQLKPLPLQLGAIRHADLYLIYPDPDYAGRGARRLGEIIQRASASLGSEPVPDPGVQNTRQG